MKVAFVVYDGMTTMDFIGVYEPITKLKTMGLLPDLKWDVCSLKRKIVRDQVGFEIVANKVGKPLSEYDVVVVPGGPHKIIPLKDEGFTDWMRTARNSKFKVSVCTGALLLGAAGFLVGKKATTHHNAFDLLATYCSKVVKNKRIVDDGDVITVGGVTSGIDLGLHLCRMYAGQNAANKVRKQIEYRG